MTRARRIGFTLLELLLVLIIVGLLATMAVPKLQSVKRRATATQIIGDFDVLRLAAMSYYADSGYFPPEAGSGKMPRNLNKYLPTSFQMKKKQWTLDYENWELKTQPRFTKTDIMVGVSVTTPDEALGQTAAALLGNAPNFTVGQKYTFLISGM